jgi:Flp pilus assembly protein TadG
MFAFLVSAMVLSIGGAVDIGRWLQARSVTKAAIDAAVLAATRQLQIDIDAPGAALAVAQSYYRANTDKRFKILDDTITFSVGEDGKGVSARGAAYIATTFLALAKIDRLPLLDVSGAEYASATMSQGNANRSKLEVSVMLDVTTSMSGPKLADLQAAAKDLVNILVRDGRDGTRVALAPFSDAVRPGNVLTEVRGQRPSTSRFQDNEGRWKTYKLSPCVSERDGNGAYTDIAPVGNDKVGPVYTRDGSCNPGAEIVPLTADRSELLGTIDGLSAGGYTAGHLGTAWAWYLLSPRWSAVLPGASAPGSYGDKKVKKVAVLMTDGEYNTQYDADGISTRDSGKSAVNGASESQSRQVCDRMKAEGIEVYTIGFALTERNAVETLAHCASSASQAYLARNGDELRQAFRDIALTLTPIHLTQ